MRLRLLLICVLVAALPVGCGGEAAQQAPPKLVRSLAQVASATEQAGSYRFDLSLRMTMPGQQKAMDITADGAVDENGRRATMTMDFGSLADLFGGLGGQVSAKDLRMEMRFDWPVVYVRMPLFAGKLPPGKEWISLDIASLARQQGMQLPGVGTLGQSDPSSFLQFLEAANAKPARIGTEKIDGARTTHYLAKIDLRELLKTLPAPQRKQLAPALEQLKQLTGNGTIAPLVDAWVGDDGLLRRFAITFSMASGGQSLDLAMVMNLHDFGEAVDVQAPKASDVADAASLGIFGG
jgi:hypothetical protein